MKLPLQTIASISNVIAGIKPDQISFKLYYRLSKISKKFQPLVGHYTDLRQSLLMKYGKKDKDGKLIISEQGMIEFNDPVNYQKDLKILNEQTENVEFESIPKEIMEELVEKVKPSVGEMAWMLEIGEEIEENKSKNDKKDS